MNLLTFSEALEESSMGNRIALLGNGFSVAWDPQIFSYKSLKENAERLSEKTAVLFDELGTVDFEEVINAYRYAGKVCNVFSISNNFQTMSDEVREVLINTIADCHPDLPSRISEVEFKNCIKFLSNFNGIYTLNYDMLLYWVTMYDMFPEGDRKSILKNVKDGFAYNDQSFLNWDNGIKTDIRYLHGALHIFESDIIVKLNYNQSNIPLKEQFINLLQHEKRYPLFVAEGSYREKLTRIRNSGYLTSSLNSLRKKGSPNRPDSMFTFGVSFSKNDRHVFEAIGVNKVQKLYVGIYGNIDSVENKKLIDNAKKVEQIRQDSKSKYPLEVRFYCAESARVWR